MNTCKTGLARESGIRFCSISMLYSLSTVLALSGPAAHAEPDVAPDIESDRKFEQGYDIAGFSYSVVPVHQGEAEMDNGGRVSLSSVQLRLGTFKAIGRGTLLGASLSYKHIDYTFTDPVAFGGQAPWDKIRSLDFGIPVLGRLNEKWSYLLAPSIGSYGEYGASQSDTRTYGIVASAGYKFAVKRRIGFGLGAYDRLDETKLFPFVSINWQLSDQLRLSNPLRAGPTGAAGLELAYSMKNNWEAAAGFARHNLRFRLDDTGSAANGIGEQTSRLLYVRLSKDLGKAGRLGLHLGTLRKGVLSLRDQNGNLLATTDNDPSPLLALSFENHF